VRGLIVIVALLIVGCSEKKVEVRYIKPHYPKLEVVELNISSIPDLNTTLCIGSIVTFEDITKDNEI